MNVNCVEIQILQSTDTRMNIKENTFFRFIKQKLYVCMHLSNVTYYVLSNHVCIIYIYTRIVQNDQ